MPGFKEFAEPETFRPHEILHILVGWSIWEVAVITVSFLVRKIGATVFMLCINFLLVLPLVACPLFETTMGLETVVVEVIFTLEGKMVYPSAAVACSMSFQVPAKFGFIHAALTIMSIFLIRTKQFPRHSSYSAPTRPRCCFGREFISPVRASGNFGLRESKAKVSIEHEFLVFRF